MSTSALRLSSLGLEPTKVFDTYWRFAAERQRIYFARLRGDDDPWSEDDILTHFRFTNAYRAADRVSQYLIRHVIYQKDVETSPEDIVFRILLFKFFNRIETWELLLRKAGEPTLRSYDFDLYSEILSVAACSGRAIYSGAYIMPSPNQFGSRRKHLNHLRLIEYMVHGGLALKLGRTRTMREGFELIRSYPSIGDFLAYQFVVDINYSELTDYSENEFVMPGPGAREGIQKAFGDQREVSDSEIVQLTTERQQHEFERLQMPFPSLFGRPLQYIDCQNLYCEVAKYSRVAHPEFTRSGGRRRIKQRFCQSGSLPEPWFPPKWGINQNIRAHLSRVRNSGSERVPATSS